MGAILVAMGHRFGHDEPDGDTAGDVDSDSDDDSGRSGDQEYDVVSVRAQLAEATRTLERLNQVRDEYRPVALSGAVLFSAVCDFSRLDHMYNPVPKTKKQPLFS